MEVTFVAPSSGASGVFGNGIAIITGSTDANGQLSAAITANDIVGSFVHRRSRGSSMVVAEQSAETFAAFDAADRITDFVTGIDQPVFQTLMITFLVRVRREFGKCLSQGCFAKEDHAVQAFSFQAQRQRHA